MACGDALGAGIEYLATGAEGATRGIVTDFAGGGPYHWKVGAYLDNTDMALRLCESLIAHPEVDYRDIAARWIAWLETEPPDVGNLTRNALVRAQALLQEGRDPREAGRLSWEMTGRDSAGNGGLMRSAPVALRFALRREKLVRVANDVCTITHYDPRCRASCVAFSLALSEMLTAERPGCPDLGDLAESVASLSPDTAAAIRAVFDLDAEELPSSRYTLDTLQAALWPTERAMSLEDGIVMIVNLAQETDHCGAVAGALLGARDGEEAIPARWLSNLRGADHIREVANQLCDIVESAISL